MKIRHVTAFSFAAALGLMVGCAEEGTEQAYEEDVYEEEEQLGGMNDPVVEDEVAVEDDPYATDTTTTTMDEPASDPTVAQDSGSMSGTTESGSMSDPEMQDDGELSEMARTEFAAFDTDSDGELTEDEFDSEDAREMVSLKNMSFDQLDQDSSGTIDPQEFARAVEGDAASGQSQGASLEQPTQE